MRHGTSNNRRQRGRNNNNGRRNNGNQSRTQVYDSNGPDVRIRGTAHQVAEKYLALAKDATVSGNNTIAENYFQHAEHYIRIINEMSADDPAANKVKGLPNSEVISDDQGNRNENHKSEVSGKAKAEAADVDDLGLPASILGPEVTMKNKVSTPATETEAVD